MGGSPHTEAARPRSRREAPSDCVTFLRWALPRLGLRWRGFRRVRRQVCRRIRRRLGDLDLDGFAEYRALLESAPEEWGRLDRLCRVTISRFLRDRRVFSRLGDEVLPELAARAAARGSPRLRAWSVGCASGEEPYGLALAWRYGAAARSAHLALTVLATDVDLTVLARARRACYEASSLREVPPEWRELAFERKDGLFRLREEHRRGVAFAAVDARAAPPAAAFDLILCRNLVLTYFAEAEQARVLRGLVDLLVPGGALVVGSHESLPTTFEDDRLERAAPCIYRIRVSTAA